MRTSESITNLAAALVKAQSVCLTVTKDKTAKVGTYSYNYSDFASVVEQIKPALAANDLAMIQWGERQDDGITVVTRLQHASGEWQETDVFIPVAQVSAQAIGSALSYGKRYGAQAFMLLPSADDDGKAATDAPPKPNTATQVAVDAFDELPIADRKYLQDLSVEIIDMANNGDDAAGYIEAKRLSTEFKLAIWSLLPSNVRSTIKRQQAAKMNKAPMLKPAPTPAELGSQA